MMRGLWHCLWLILPVLVAAQDLESDARADLGDALQRLSEQRSLIGAEKSVLLKQVNALEAKVREQRRALDRLERSALRNTDDFQARREQIASRERQLERVENALLDYRNYLETTLHATELAAFQEEIARIETDVEAGEVSLAERWRRLSTFGLRRLEAASGGEVVAGEAVIPTGERAPGRYLLWGPLAYFSPDWTDESGFVLAGTGLTPRLSPFADSAARPQLEAALDGRVGALPIDASGGRAVALAEEDGGWSSRLHDGGVWIWPILVLAALALVVFVAKVIQISRVRLPRLALLEPVLADLEAGRTDAARAKIEQCPPPVSELFADALARADHPREALEDAMLEHVIRWQMRWERGLPVLAVTAAVSPLLGLLGTVTGMIATFRLIGVYGSADARPLSGGIAEALITTELGLLVAIPALIAHAVLSRKAQSLTAELESLATRFIDFLLTPKSPTKPPDD